MAIYFLIYIYFDYSKYIVWLFFLFLKNLKEKGLTYLGQFISVSTLVNSFSHWWYTMRAIQYDFRQRTRDTEGGGVNAILGDQ